MNYDVECQASDFMMHFSRDVFLNCTTATDVREATQQVRMIFDVFVDPFIIQPLSKSY